MKHLLIAILLTAMAVAQHPDTKRTKQIQHALRKQGYKSIQVSGEWDEQTQSALKDIAKRNHWQTAYVPDANVLIVLGLGPNYKKLLNPETAQIASTQSWK